MYLHGSTGVHPGFFICEKSRRHIYRIKLKAKSCKAKIITINQITKINLRKDEKRKTIK